MVAHADRNAFDKELCVMLNDALQQEFGELRRSHHGESDVHHNALDQLLDVSDFRIIRTNRVIDVDLGDFVQQPVFDVPKEMRLLYSIRNVFIRHLRLT